MEEASSVSPMPTMCGFHFGDRESASLFVQRYHSHSQHLSISKVTEKRRRRLEEEDARL